VQTYGIVREQTYGIVQVQTYGKYGNRRTGSTGTDVREVREQTYGIVREQTYGKVLEQMYGKYGNRRTGSTGTDVREGTGTDVRKSTGTDVRNSTGADVRNSTGTDVREIQVQTYGKYGNRRTESTGTDVREGTGIATQVVMKAADSKIICYACWERGHIKRMCRNANGNAVRRNNPENSRWENKFDKGSSCSRYCCKPIVSQ
jgi:hypothetical protein